MSDTLYIFGDSLALMAELEDESIDFILTDPPYNITRPNNLHTMSRRGIEWKWDGQFDQFAWLAIAVPKLKKWGSLVIFNDWKNLGDIAKVLTSLNCEPKRDLVYSKTNPFPRNIERSYVQAREYALWAVKNGSNGSKGPRWTFHNTKKNYETGEFRYPVQKSKHPTKKPDGMFEELVLIHTNPGDLVLDPFAGEATTAKACRKTGRKSISFENDPTNYADGLAALNEK